MIVFVRLSRAVLEKHWIPNLYGKDAAELDEVFERSTHELDEIAAKVLTPAQRAQLTQIVDTWLADNPSQMRVEGIRLMDFAEVAANAAERATQTEGLLASVRSAARAADLALNLSERGLFMVQRLPFVWRLQVRLGAREIMSDTMKDMVEGPNAPLPRLRRQAAHIARRGALYLVSLLSAGGLVSWWILRARRSHA
jgi:hypothetical protein